MLRRLINIYSFPFFLFLLLLSACKVGKEYQRPAVDLPTQFSNTTAQDTASVGNLSWKQFFTDTALQHLVEQGIAHNYDLLQALKRIDAAEQQVKRARLLQLPEANLQISGAINRPSENSLNGLSASSFLGKNYIENYNAIVNLSWEADIWGKIRRQKEVTLTAYLQTFEAAKAVQTQLVASIASGYFNLQMLDNQLEVTKQNLALADSFVTVTNLLQRSGEVTALAVQQAELQQQATAYLIPGIEQDIKLQENALQLLTGHLPGSLHRKKADDKALSEQLATGLPASLLHRRPDVRADELALVAANTKVGIAQANMYPALNITAGAGLESFKSANWISIPNSLFVLAASSITQPLFQRLELKTNLETARIQREEAVLKFRQSVLTAIIEVENALIKIDKAAGQKTIADGQSQIAKLAIQNAQLLFKNDMANYLEVITAQQRALQSELQVASVERIQKDAVLELYRALGGGWQ